MTTTQTNQRDVAKSLHTVTVIVQVAHHLMERHYNAQAALDASMRILGLDGRPDPYRLKDVAARQLGVNL